MARKRSILKSDLINFSTLLTRWSECESSFFLRQFWRTFAMTEMQFYKRLWKSQQEVIGFDFNEVKKNLRRNRFHRAYKKKMGIKTTEKININFKRK